MAEIIPLPAPTFRQTTLDEVFAEAETLGKVSIGNCFPEKYRATIQFSCRLGTVFAEGKHDVAVVALGIAINNARELGAGVTS